MKKLLKLHKIVGRFSLIPLLLICLSGIVLEFRNQVNWLSPSRPVIGKNKLPVKWINSKEVLEMHQQKRWGNNNKALVKTIVYNLAEGFISIRTTDDFEYNLHGETGVLLSFGNKRSLFFNRLHQELFLENKGRWFAAFPAALMLLFLLLSGGVLTFKRKKNAK